jgi:hypothetical protein
VRSKPTDHVCNRFCQWFTRRSISFHGRGRHLEPSEPADEAGDPGRVRPSHCGVAELRHSRPGLGDRNLRIIQ